MHLSGKILILGFCFFCLILACEKNLPPPGPAPVLKSSLLAWATPESVAYKGTATIFWQSENVTCLTINGKTCMDLKSGSMTVSGLVKDSIFKFTATGLDGLSLAQSLLVKVGQPTRTDTLCSRYWQLSTKSRYLFEGEWYYFNWSKEWLADKYFFYPNGKIEVFDQMGQLTSNGTWSWVGKDSIENGEVYKYLLTDNTFYQNREGWNYDYLVLERIVFLT